MHVAFADLHVAPRGAAEALPMMGDVRVVAELLRWVWDFGLVRADAVVMWAAERFMTESVNPRWLLEVATLSEGPGQEPLSDSIAEIFARESRREDAATAFHHAVRWLERAVLAQAVSLRIAVMVLVSCEEDERVPAEVGSDLARLTELIRQHDHKTDGVNLSDAFWDFVALHAASDADFDALTREPRIRRLVARSLA